MMSILETKKKELVMNINGRQAHFSGKKNQTLTFLKDFFFFFQFFFQFSNFFSRFAHCIHCNQGNQQKTIVNTSNFFLK